ncbi:MAG: hypothetical protein ABIQ44_02915 [Chloroflexia bacterium]
MTSLLKPGQTLIFLGDHTSPDDLGYVSIIKDVLSRFHPKLQIRLISAGSRRQTASALSSQALTDIITSSKPDWLIVGIGLSDALREPIVAQALRNPGNSRTQREMDDAENTFGPELRVRRESRGPISDVGHEPEPQVDNVGTFEQGMTSALKKFAAAGINVAVLTTILAGTDPTDVINKVLKSYSKAIRVSTQESGTLLIDIEKAYRDVLDRALNYKQSIALASPIGEPNAQGQALLARSVLDAFGILPQPGWRPFR